MPEAPKDIPTTRFSGSKAMKLGWLGAGQMGFPMAGVTAPLVTTSAGPRFTVHFNRDAAPEAMTAIARALGVESAASGLFDLAARVGAPTSLRELGLDEENLDRAADIATESPYKNPQPVDRDGIRALLDNAFHGRRPD